MVRPVSRSAADDGFTLVELVVALTILAVGIVGVIGVTNSSFRVAGGASARSKMVAIATKELEALRAIPYKELASHYPLAESASAPVETETKTSGGLTYTIQRVVTKGTTSGARHYSALVTVSWTDASGAHEVHQSSYLYPGGIGPETPSNSTPTTVASCTPSKPAGVVATRAADPTQATSTVDLTWSASASTCPAATYVIRYVTGLSSIINELTRLATSTSYRVTGLTAGTEYKFQVAARSASGQLSTWSDIASVTTATWIGSTCRFGTITLTPPSVNKKSNGQGAGLREAVLVRVPTEGTCPALNAVYSPTSTSTKTTPLVKGSDGAYTGNLDVTTTWDVGRRYIDIIKTTDNTKAGSVLLTVCEHNVSNCS